MNFSIETEDDLRVEGIFDFLLRESMEHSRQVIGILAVAILTKLYTSERLKRVKRGMSEVWRLIWGWFGGFVLFAASVLEFLRELCYFF